MIHPRYTLLVHPDNAPLVRGMIAELGRARGGGGRPGHMVMETEVVVSEFVPRRRRRWVPPRGRFWEFEERDSWAEKLGFGHYEDTGEPVVYQIDRDRRWGYEFFRPSLFRPPTSLLVTNLS